MQSAARDRMLAPRRAARIDAHHHLWRYVPEEFPWIERGSAIARDFPMEELLAELDAQGIDGCIAVQARQQEAETQWLTRLAADAPQVLGVVGWIDLRSHDIEARLDRTAVAGVVGYRHVVQDVPGGGLPRSVRARRQLCHSALPGLSRLRNGPDGRPCVCFERARVIADGIIQFGTSRFLQAHVDLFAEEVLDARQAVQMGTWI